MARFLVAFAVLCTLACATHALPQSQGQDQEGQAVAEGRWFFPIRPGFLPWIPINIPTRPPPQPPKEDDKKEDDKEDDKKEDDKKEEDKEEDKEEAKDDEKPETEE